MKSKKLSTRAEMQKPDFGSIYMTKGSKYLYLSFYYYKQRLRFPTDRVDTLKDREELRQFMNGVGEKIKHRTLCFAKAFYWLDEETKKHFSKLEGGEVLPEPQHVTFGEYAKTWIDKKIPTFASVTKQRDYRESLTSRIIPYFGAMPFASITATEVDTFIDTLKRAARAKEPAKSGGAGKVKPLSVKRIKNIISPMTKIWTAACNDYSWKDLMNPFIGITEKFTELTDRGLQELERQIVLLGEEEFEEASRREVFLCSEWRLLLEHIDPHYHLAMDLMLMGMIGSELEALQKQHVRGAVVHVRCAVVRDKEGRVHMKFKPKNWYRKRQLPMTRRLRGLVDIAVAASQSPAIIEFANDIALPASQFVLTMKDGSPFNYDSFVKTVWNKAMRETALPARVPYASRHTLVQWALLIGVTKTRLVDLMGHSTKKMIDEVYGSYRQGLVDEKEAILDYLGEDVLALEELKTAYPERYRRQMGVGSAEKPKAPDLAATFSQSFGQSQGLYADNYLM